MYKTHTTDFAHTYHSHNCRTASYAIVSHGCHIVLAPFIYLCRQGYIHFTLLRCPHSHPHVPVHNRNLAHMECMGVLTVHWTPQEDEFASYVSLTLACLYVASSNALYTANTLYVTVYM